MHKLCMCRWISSALEISVIVCACLEDFSIENVARTIEGTGNNALSSISSWSKTVGESFPALGTGLAFFAAPPKSRSDLKKARHRNSVGHMANDQTCNQKSHLYCSSKQKGKQPKTLNSEPTCDRNREQNRHFSL